MIEAMKKTERDPILETRSEPSLDVPENPGKVALHLENPHTPEGSLMEKVLDEQGGSVATVALGMCGFGKISALIGVGHNNSVKNCFTGGVYWMSLGQNATNAYLVQMMAKIVRDSGGGQLSEEAINARDLRGGVAKAVQWFTGHRCLFVCDDLWRTALRRCAISPR